MAWVGVFADRFIAEATLLDHEAHSALWLLRMTQWLEQQPLPDDDAVLARAVRMTPGQWRRARRHLLRFFDVANGRWACPWVAERAAEARTKIAKARASANWRWHGTGGG